jgi:hypothetical protein
MTGTVLSDLVTIPGVKEAEKVSGLSCAERLDVVLLHQLPTDDEWDDEDSPGRFSTDPQLTTGPLQGILASL